jgi:hypothetical protein
LVVCDERVNAILELPPGVQGTAEEGSSDTHPDTLHCRERQWANNISKLCSEPSSAAKQFVVPQSDALMLITDLEYISDMKMMWTASFLAFDMLQLSCSLNPSFQEAS